MDCRRVYLSANTPAINAPTKDPSSNTAAALSQQFVLNVYAHIDRGSVVRTHKSSVPRAQMPPVHKVLHDEHVCDHALVVTEREAANGGEYGTTKGVVVMKEPRNASWTISICIVCSVGMYIEDTSVRDVPM